MGVLSGNLQALSKWIAQLGELFGGPAAVERRGALIDQWFAPRVGRVTTIFGDCMRVPFRTSCVRSFIQRAVAVIRTTRNELSRRSCVGKSGIQVEITRGRVSMTASRLSIARELIAIARLVRHLVARDPIEAKMHRTPRQKIEEPTIDQAELRRPSEQLRYRFIYANQRALIQSASSPSFKRRRGHLEVTMRWTCRPRPATWLHSDCWRYHRLGRSPATRDRYHRPCLLRQTARRMKAYRNTRNVKPIDNTIRHREHRRLDPPCHAFKTRTQAAEQQVGGSGSRRSLG